MSPTRPQSRGIRSHARRGRLVAAVAVIALASACGTTLHLGAAGSLSSAGDDGLGLPGVTSGPSLAPSGDGVTGGGSTSSGEPTAVPSAAATDAGSTASASSTSSATAPVVGPASHAPITVGLLTTATSNAASFGASSGNTINETSVDEALIKALNAQGGLDGRPIVPVFASTDTGGSSWSGEFAAACASFTQDHHVVAVLGYNFAYIDSFEKCLADKDIPHLSTTEAGPSNASFKTYPDLFSLMTPSIDRRNQMKIDGGLASGLISAKSKLGILVDSCADDASVFNSETRPYIKSKGLTITVFAELGCPDGAADAAGEVSQLEDIILKMQSQGVTDVMFDGDSESGAQLLFAESAQSQGFHPVYIDSSIATLPSLGSDGAPKAQLAQMHSFGYQPSLDVSPGRFPALNAAQLRCLSLLRSQGIRPTSTTDYLYAFNICDAVFLYGEALVKDGGQTGAAAIAKAVEEVGGSHQSVTSLGGLTAISPDRHDGPSEDREVSWSGSCSCFLYTGPTARF